MPIRRGRDALTDGYDKVAEEMERLSRPEPDKPRWPFILVIGVLIAVCLGLGTWQMQRLGEKEAQIARIAERATLAPVDLPAIGEWGVFDLEAWDYRHTIVNGKYRDDQTVLVFTSLTEPQGAESGPGYWVMTPLVTDAGGVVWVNRGFVPERLKTVFADGGPPEIGAANVTGILRRPEAANMFTPGIERNDRIDWIRDPARLAGISDPALAPVLGAYLDREATPGGGLPQGGETKFDLPNRHFEYALTWYGLAAVAAGMLGFWLFARRKG